MYLVQGNWIMERTDQRENKTAGCMTSHATCTRQLDDGENRLEGKLDSWPNVTCTQHKNLRWQVI